MGIMNPTCNWNPAQDIFTQKTGWGIWGRNGQILSYLLWFGVDEWGVAGKRLHTGKISRQQQIVLWWPTSENQKDVYSSAHSQLTSQNDNNKLESFFPVSSVQVLQNKTSKNTLNILYIKDLINIIFLVSQRWFLTQPSLGCFP